jgi:YD repeat-containing protein
MSRRSTVSLLASLALAVVVVDPASAARTSTKVEPLPLVQDHVIENVCEFPVGYTDRGGRMLTTRYDRAGRMVSQTISGTSIVELTNLANKTTESFEIDEVQTIVYRRDGTVNVVQLGSSGIAIDPGTSTRTPDLVWYGGLVVSRGTLDRSFLLADVTRQSRVGVEGDICDILVTGLKTRH